MQGGRSGRQRSRTASTTASMRWPSRPMGRRQTGRPRAARGRGFIWERLAASGRRPSEGSRLTILVERYIEPESNRHRPGWRRGWPGARCRTPVATTTWRRGRTRSRADAPAAKWPSPRVARDVGDGLALGALDLLSRSRPPTRAVRPAPGHGGSARGHESRPDRPCRPHRAYSKHARIYHPRFRGADRVSGLNGRVRLCTLFKDLMSARAATSPHDPQRLRHAGPDPRA